MLKLPLNTLKVLERRYLLKDNARNVIETPSELFRRYGTKKEQVLSFSAAAKEPERLINAASEYSGGCAVGVCPF